MLGGPNGTSPHNRHQTVNYIKCLEEYFSQMSIGSPEFKTSKMEKKVSIGGGRTSKKGTTMKYCSSVKVNNQRFQASQVSFKFDSEKFWFKQKTFRLILTNSILSKRLRKLLPRLPAKALELEHLEPLPQVLELQHPLHHFKFILLRQTGKRPTAAS